MKRNTFPFLRLGVMILGVLMLAACVRPVPRENPPTPAPTSETPIVLPTPLPTLPPTAEGQEPTDGNGVVEGPTAEPTAEPSATPRTEETTYVVQAGDTLFRISQRFGVPVDVLAAANNLANVNQLEVGQVLVIPAPGATDGDGVVVAPTPTMMAMPTAVPGQPATHVVQPGENLFRIGLRYGCTVDQMARANNIINPARIEVGQVLVIPNCGD